ncbi:CLUMA_CG010784, isoform A [Clunio marinus]|uniref:CLUMA_CG010784, isoform A n=1 Tax=Clunio marinus TaxID=568069 RepID=A0A1J1ICB4_9DIPT|nr:CLUMA_CG010784, isoform A [Clunio marinus]
MASVKIPEQKVILVGDFGIGKSSLFRRFMCDTFINSSDRKATLGLDHYSKTFHVNNRNINLQLFDTGGMERIASVTSSYYKFAEAAILVFSVDNAQSFHSLSQHLVDITMWAESAKIFLCGNRIDLDSEVSDLDMQQFCEQCHGLISATFKTSCKTNEGVKEMFEEIAKSLVENNRSRLELQALESHGFKVHPPEENVDSCAC